MSALMTRTGIELSSCKGIACYWNSTHFQKLIEKKAKNDLRSLLEIICFIKRKQNNICQNFKKCMITRLNAIKEIIAFPEEMIFLIGSVGDPISIQFIDEGKYLLKIKAKRSYGFKEKILENGFREIKIKEEDLSKMF